MKYLPIIASVFLTASCMVSMEMGGMEDNMSVSPELIGNICDEDGNPIEHIKVTLIWNYGEYQDIKYTSNEGKFYSMIRINDRDEATTLTVILEDIDKEENGGIFEPLTDTMTLFDEQESEDKIIVLDYRLSRATASESNRRS